MSDDPFLYRAAYRRVVADNGVDMRVDLGFGVRRELSFRLSDVMFPDFFRGTMEFLDRWFKTERRAHGGEWPFLLTTEKHVIDGDPHYFAQVYGRESGEWLADVIDRRFE